MHYSCLLEYVFQSEQKVAHEIEVTNSDLVISKFWHIFACPASWRCPLYLIFFLYDVHLVLTQIHQVWAVLFFFWTPCLPANVTIQRFTFIVLSLGLVQAALTILPQATGIHHQLINGSLAIYLSIKLLLCLIKCGSTSLASLLSTHV